MPVIGIVVSFVGSQIGVALLGEALGATLAGAIGAGVASGAFAESQGGDFGKGFLMGAGGSLVGAGINSAFGSVGGATGSLTSPTVDSMFADQMSGFTNAGDLSGASGWGDTIGSSGTAGFGTSAYDPSGYDLSGTGDLSLQPFNDPLQGGTPTSSTPMFDDQMMGVNSGFNLDNLSGQNYANTFTNVDINSNPSLTSTPDYLSVDDMSPAKTKYTGLDNLTSQNPAQTGASTQPATGLGDIAKNQSVLTSDANPVPIIDKSVQGTTPSFMDKVQGLVSSSDQYLNKSFGLPKGSTMMGAMGIASYMQDSYNTYKMEQIAKGLKPMSLEEFTNSYYNPNDYKAAANTMAKAGHTGTLPVLMARMNSQAGSDYAKNYLPNAQSNWWNANAQIGQAKSNAVGNLTAPWAYSWAMGQTGKK